MITATTAKTKCDIKDCRNDAEYQFAIKGRVGRCYLCSKCLGKLTSDGMAFRTPKSPQSAIKRQLDKKQKEAILIDD